LLNENPSITNHPELPNPLGFAPLRQQKSSRRTTSIDVTWPQEMRGTMAFDAIARDIYTAENTVDFLVIQQDNLLDSIDADRYIKAISANPKLANVEEFVGHRGGGHLRLALDEIYGEDQQRDYRPAFLLIDDISGASLVAPWARSKWPKLEPEHSLGPETIRQIRQKMEGVCIGFAPGNSAFSSPLDQSIHRSAKVPPLHHPEDPDGWHQLPEHNSITMRRARRIDLWLDEDIEVDAMFQDSASLPEGGREAVHEYHLQVSAEANTGIIKRNQITPHILPFPECPRAVNNAQKMVGTPLSELRHSVLENLRKTNGCTHVNDALRALADVS